MTESVASMTLHSKIRISNILMVLIPVIISLTGVFLVAKTSMGNHSLIVEFS